MGLVLPVPKSAAVGDGTVVTVTHDKSEITIEGAVEKVVALEFSFVDAMLTFDKASVGIVDDEDEPRITQLAGE